MRCLALALLLPACTTISAPPTWSATPTGVQQALDDHGEFGDRILFEAQAIPGAWLTRDLDGVSSNGDSTTSAGFGLRAASGNRDQSIGVLWQSLHGDGDGLDVEALGLDLDVRTPLRDGKGLFWLRAGATLGGAWIDELAGNDREFQGAAQLRLGIDFQPTHWCFFGPSIGGIVLGHPGETEAYGALVTLGGALVF